MALCPTLFLWPDAEYRRAESGQMRLHPMVTAFAAGWAAGA
ncbi:hypothetical protein AtDm6_0054 [Acetobacter tropicalis]|uniref:Uncharacterized protein n=1 Tax=Acetobacter tropicalis TaxID=104102 RepID=A0A094YXH3_9PROT|nr:hypothetical protein AtDm6_0054 [Acetobacter tropicalis]